MASAFAHFTLVRLLPVIVAFKFLLSKIELKIKSINSIHHHDHRYHCHHCYLPSTLSAPSPLSTPYRCTVNPSVLLTRYAPSPLLTRYAPSHCQPVPTANSVRTVPLPTHPHCQPVHCQHCELAPLSPLSDRSAPSHCQLLEFAENGKSSSRKSEQHNRIIIKNQRQFTQERNSSFSFFSSFLI